MCDVTASRAYSLITRNGLSLKLSACKGFITQTRSLNAASLLIAFTYFIVIFTLNNPDLYTLCPDELWFIKLAKQGTLLENWLSYHLGYGGGYWAVLKLIRKVPLLAKYLFLICLMVPLGITFYYTQGVRRLLGVCFWLTSYAAWWNGKIISPDSINYALFSIIIWLLVKQHTSVATVLLGIAIGLKLNALITVITVTAVFFKQFLANPRHIIRLVLLMAIGVGISAPALLLNFSDSMQAIKSETALNFETRYRIFLNSLNYKIISWDFVYCVGIFCSYWSWLGYGLIFLSFLKDKSRIGLIWVVGFLMNGVFISFGPFPYTWYWLPFLSAFYTYLFVKSEINFLCSLSIMGLVLIVIGQIETAFIQSNILFSEKERLVRSHYYISCLSPYMNKTSEISSFLAFESKISKAAGYHIKHADLFYLKTGSKRNSKIDAKNIIADKKTFIYLNYTIPTHAIPICKGEFYKFEP